MSGVRYASAAGQRKSDSHGLRTRREHAAVSAASSRSGVHELGKIFELLDSVERGHKDKLDPKSRLLPHNEVEQ